MSSDQIPRLGVGAGPSDGSRMCAMQVISWQNGDTTITDLPECADLMLAKIVQNVNDSYCTHRDGDLLCPSCSIEVLALAHRTVGTGYALDLTPLERQRIWVRVAVDQARSVAHLNPDPRVKAAIDAAEAWANDAAAATAAAATAAYAAATAAYAAATTYATTRMTGAHRAIDIFQQHAGITDQPHDPAATACAIEQMLVTA